MNAEVITIQLALQRPAFSLNVNLQLPAQGITALFGASGSGKTTLLRCVAGLERAHPARVQMGDAVWQDDAQSLFLPAWRRPLGYVFQESSLFDHLDVQGNLEYGLKRVSAKQNNLGNSRTLAASIELLGIGALLQRRPQQLSGGERQRVAIARAIALQPRLLLLDEPLASLDYTRQQEILPWLERLRDETRIPMLYVTHALDEVTRLADTLVVLDAGTVRAVGPTAQVLSATQSPMHLGDEAGAVLEGTVAAKDAQWHLAQVGFAGGSLWLRDTGLTLGQRVRVRVSARDVSVSTTEPQHTSIQNLLPCTVDSVEPDEHPSQVLVRLRCGTSEGSSHLWARMTARAGHTLALVPGKAVWAQIKSAALAK